jgi:hypothetical protein
MIGTRGGLEKHCIGIVFAVTHTASSEGRHTNEVAKQGLSSQMDFRFLKQSLQSNFL